MKAYHSLEKGLALPNPRPGFGQPAALGVIAACEQHLTRYGLAQPVLDAVGALKEYCRFQHAAGADLWKVWDRLEGLENAVSAEAGKVRGGTTVLTTEAIRDATQGISADFFSTRHSVRQFTDEPIDRALIDEALMRAQRTPSVCNRHCARVHVLTGAAAKARALSFQNGNRGFGHQASVVFIVTADLSAFMDAGERFQGWIDGGMYAMSLVYSLHSLGLGSCTLNWSVTPGRDRKLRAAMNVPGNELVIMMIAAGHIPDSLKVASSPRPPIEATTRYLGDRASDQPPHVQSLPS